MIFSDVCNVSFMLLDWLHLSVVDLFIKFTMCCILSCLLRSVGGILRMPAGNMLNKHLFTRFRFERNIQHFLDIRDLFSRFRSQLSTYSLFFVDVQPALKCHRLNTYIKRNWYRDGIRSNYYLQNTYFTHSHIWKDPFKTIVDDD